MEKRLQRSSPVITSIRSSRSFSSFAMLQIMVAALSVWGANVLHKQKFK
jgi:hypothetical protein